MPYPANPHRHWVQALNCEALTVTKSTTVARESCWRWGKGAYSKAFRVGPVDAEPLLPSPFVRIEMNAKRWPRDAAQIHLAANLAPKLQRVTNDQVFYVFEATIDIMPMAA